MRLGVAEIAVIMVFGIPLAAVVGGVLIVLVKTLKGSGGKNSGKMNADEARLFQEMNANLKKMEERIDSLETILFERSNREKEVRQ